jgi:NADH-quinone oxidoreductase subunit F
MDFDSLAAVGSMAGSGGVIVMDDTRDMVETLNNLNEFYAHESCGQCTPCAKGSLWMKKITDRVLAGGGTERDPDLLKNVAGQHRRQDDLRLWRSVLLADAKLRGEVPRRLRGLL